MAEKQIKLNERDQQVDKASGGKIAEAKGAWNDAKAEYDKATNDADRQKALAKMNTANQNANKVRNQYGNYTAGTSGTDYIPTGGGSSIAGGGGGASKKPSLNATDSALLNADQQARLLDIKNRYQTAFDQGASADVLAGYNHMANDIRAEAHYSGGKTGNDYVVLAVNEGGKTADQIRKEAADFKAANTKGNRYVNGYGVDMNVRSQANLIRQQMAANSEAWHGADEETRKYLHDQNMALADVLYDYTGQSEKTTYYNEDKGRWETWNPNVGYGYMMNGTQPNIRNAWKQYYGYTDEEIENWANDTSHYYNFVDVMAPARNTIDESSGFTGQYAQFFNGPYIQWLTPTSWSNSTSPLDTGEGMLLYKMPQYDEDGNIIKTAPTLNYNNDVSAYTRQFLPVPVNGVLRGHGPKVDALDPTTGDNNIEGQRNYYYNVRSHVGGRGSSGGSAGGFEGYLQQLYASALEAQLKALESGYAANLSELDASQTAIDGAYKEQKRQTSGESARQSAAWREVANAYGLNSGAVGQASLAQRNQLQSDLNRLNAAQASARTELQRQRLLLGQQYQLAIQEAVAENNSELARSLYEEAVRAEESLQQQEQFYANLSLQYGKSMMSFAKNTGSMSNEAKFDLIEEAVRNGFISDAQAMALAQYFGYV